MTNTRMTTCVMAVVLSLASSPALAAIHFSDGQIHDIDYHINDSVWVDYQAPGMQTTVNWLDGASTSAGGELGAYCSSRVTVSGGSIDNDLWVHDNSIVTVSGGSIARWLYAYGGQVTVSGGLIGMKLLASGTAQVTILGGSIGEGLWVWNPVSVSGGLIGGDFRVDYDGILTLHGSGFAVDGEPFGYGELTSIFSGPYEDEPYRHLTGTLASGDPIANNFRIGHDSKIVLIHQPAIIYVDADASGANNGSSWTDAYNYLQDALSVAWSGDEIRVAQGIYKPDEDSAYPNGTGSRTATFQLINGVTIKGGYAGFAEPDPDARDVDAYPTILTGDLSGNDGPDFADNVENTVHIVTADGADATAILDGFTITAGNADFPSPSGDANRGGAIFNHSGRPTIKNCTFIGNRASESGGAIYNYHSSNPTLINCTFTANFATDHGGAIYNRTYSEPNIISCTFTQNKATRGGAIRNKTHGSPTITDCAFIDNHAHDTGGAIFNDNHCHTTISHCTFTENFADKGAAIANMTHSKPSIANSIFTGNSAGQDGGAISNDNHSSPTVANSIFTGNSAGQDGGVAYNYNYSSITLTNCTAVNNVAFYGGGTFNRNHSTTTLTNCLFWGNTSEGSEIYRDDKSSTAVVTYTLIRGEWPGHGNMYTKPHFVDHYAGNLRLKSNSACINAGDPDYVAGPNETDLDGLPRVIGGRIDMGAYEYPNTTPVACIVGSNRIVEAEAPWGARVTLDGSCSSDSDSTPGTNDDIVSFDWYKVDACDPNFEDFLASGEIIDCNLPLGEHIIVLEVIDKASAFDTNEVTIIVQDTTPPDFTLSVTPTTLWPANHKMVLITPTWTASDICDASPEVSLVSITMNEDDEAKGDGHTTLNIQISDDGSIYLRAERSGTGSGRIYTITYQAVDDSGNVAVARATVTVPHDQR